MKHLSNHSFPDQTAASRQRGFTLIEMMVVVIIIGILVKIALPAYTNSVQKAYRTDAKSALLDLATREEKFYSVNNQYTATLSNLYPGLATTTLPVASGSTSYYTISAPTVSGPPTASVAAFTASAVPNATSAQANDPCGTFTITSTGVTSVSTTMTNCW